MTKLGMARMTQRIKFLEHTHAASKDALVEVLQTTYSAIATIDPTLALSILDQLNEQREGIETLKEERKNDKEKFINLLAAKLPDVMEMEPEDADLDPEEED